MRTLLLNKIRFIILVIFTLIPCFSVLAAEFRISNNKLIVSGSDVEDVEGFLLLLEKNEKIEIIVFQDVGGGQQHIGIEIADIIIDFELDTHIEGECYGSCNLMFMGGKKRTLARGSEIGITFNPYTRERIQDILDNKTYEYVGDLADYIIWVDETARTELIEYFSLLIERGVNPIFIIDSLKKASSDTWIPRRKELLEANILTE